MTAADIAVRERRARAAERAASDGDDPSLDRLAERAYDRYADACHERDLCLQYGCRTVSTDHSYCREHRPK